MLLAETIEIPDSGGWGIRKIEGIDGSRLRLFFISLLWRAAVSEMVEFREVAAAAHFHRQVAPLAATCSSK